jgi:hypothetical protein
MTNIVFLSLILSTNLGSTPHAEVHIANVVPGHQYILQNSQSLNDWSLAGNAYFTSGSTNATIVYLYDYHTYNQQFYRVIDP